MNAKSFSDRRRGPRKLVVAMLALAGVAGIAAAAALAGSSQRQLTLHISQTAKIEQSGSTLAMYGSVVCKTKRFFALSADVVDVTSGATAHGALPLPGKRVPTCTPPRKAFTVVATQEGEAKPIGLTAGRYRACLFIHTWARHGSFTLDARCFTLHASRS